MDNQSCLQTAILGRVLFKHTYTIEQDTTAETKSRIQMRIDLCQYFNVPNSDRFECVYIDLLFLSGYPRDIYTLVCIKETAGL